MKGEFLAGAVIGAAFIAACYSDTFRNTCRQAINGVGDQVNKQISGLWNEINKPREEQDHGQSASDV